MRHIAAIVLILGLCLPQTLLAGVVLKVGEIDSSKVKVGVYAEVIYGKDEWDQVSGAWKKLDTAQGYIKAVDQKSLTISQGLGKRIAFDRIQQLILAESSFQMNKFKKTTDIYFFMQKEDKPKRIFGKLFGGVLVGGLFALAGGGVGMKVWDCSENEGLCVLEGYVRGALIGYVVGVPAGINRMDAYDRFTYTLAGSLIGGAAGLGVTYAKEDFWPALVICPLVGATIMSEFSRELPENRRVFIGLLPGPKGRLSAVATLRF